MDPHHLVSIFIMVAASFQSTHLVKIPFIASMQKFVKTEYLEDCDQNNYPMRMVNFTYVRNGSDLIINGEEIVSRDMKSPMKAQFLIDKCRDKSNPDTCEYYNTWKWDDLCGLFKMPFAKLALNSCTPPYSCPVKKNYYYFKNIRTPADLWVPFLAYSNPNVLWKFEFRKIEDALTVGCVKFGLRIVNVRIRS